MRNKILNYVILAIVFVFLIVILLINRFSLDDDSKDMQDESTNEEVIDKYYTKKTDEGIFFNITQTKPSSCHIINFNKTNDEKNIILDLDISKYTDRCISSSAYDTVSGEIKIKDPESIEIRLNGNRVYYRNFIVE